MALDGEAGGHRIQGVPPTERRGRVHTSTVTVAVVDPESAREVSISDHELKITWFSGTGKGGQHRNKHQNSCRVVHILTGFSETRQSREKDANLRDAVGALKKRVAAALEAQDHDVRSALRREQIGSGMRGDKTVTIRFQDDTAKHHVTGKSISASRYMRGEMDELWS
nr:peptide chain release factor-like protein [Jiella sp. LLJ827]